MINNCDFFLHSKATFSYKTYCFNFFNKSQERFIYLRILFFYSSFCSRAFQHDKDINNSLKKLKSYKKVDNSDVRRLLKETFEVRHDSINSEEGMGIRAILEKYLQLQIFSLVH